MHIHSNHLNPQYKMLALLQRLRPSPPDRLLLLKMPLEIIEEIVTYLAIQDLACFALTRKFLFFRYYPSFHKAPVLCGRRPVTNEKPSLCPNAEKQLPLRFLRCLENSRWKLCLECWKLHPRTKSSLPWRHHCYECYVLYGGKCVLDAGVIDLCPCLTITYQDLYRLIEVLKRVQHNRQSASREKVTDYENVFCSSLSGYRNDELVHKCKITDHPEAKADITTTIFLDSEARFVVRNQYRFKSFVPTACLAAKNQSSLCPHENTSRWLQSFFNGVGDGFTGHRKSLWRRWRRSECLLTTPGTIPDSKSFEVLVTRKLGDGKGNNWDWKHNRRREGPSWDQKLREMIHSLSA